MERKLRKIKRRFSDALTAAAESDSVVEVVAITKSNPAQHLGPAPIWIPALCVIRDAWRGLARAFVAQRFLAVFLGSPLNIPARHQRPAPDRGQQNHNRVNRMPVS